MAAIQRRFARSRIGNRPLRFRVETGTSQVEPRKREAVRGCVCCLWRTPESRPGGAFSFIKLSIQPDTGCDFVGVESGGSDPEAEMTIALLRKEETFLVQKKQTLQRRSVLKVHPHPASNRQALLGGKCLHRRASLGAPPVESGPAGWLRGFVESEIELVVHGEMCACKTHKICKKLEPGKSMRVRCGSLGPHARHRWRAGSAFENSSIDFRFSR